MSLSSRWPTSRARYVPLLSVALALGCESAPTSESDANEGGPAVVAASSATRAAIGVDTWHVEADGDTTIVQGVDANGATIVRFGQKTIKDTSGDVHREIISIMRGEARARYTEHADGSFSVEENGLPAEQDAVDAARHAYGDLEADGGAGGGFSTSLISAKDLVDSSGGGAPLTREQASLVNSGRDTTGRAAACGGGDCSGPQLVTGAEPLTCIGSGKQDLGHVIAFTEHCGYQMNVFNSGSAGIMRVDQLGPSDGGWQKQDAKCRFEGTVIFVNQQGTAQYRQSLQGNALGSGPETLNADFSLMVGYSLTTIDPNGCRYTEERTRPLPDDRPCPSEPVCRGNVPGSFTPAQECYDSHKPYIKSPADLDSVLRYCGCFMGCNR